MKTRIKRLRETMKELETARHEFAYNAGRVNGTLNYLQDQPEKFNQELDTSEAYLAMWEEAARITKSDIAALERELKQLYAMKTPILNEQKLYQLDVQRRVYRDTYLMGYYDALDHREPLSASNQKRLTQELYDQYYVHPIKD